MSTTTASTGTTGDTGAPAVAAGCGVLAEASAIGSSGWDFPRDIAVSPDGSSYVSGSFGDDLTFDPGGPAETELTLSAAGTNTFVARYAADGTFEWVRQFVGAEVALAPTSDGGVFVTGAYYAPAEIAVGQPDALALPATDSDGDAYVARLDAAGGVSWVSTILGRRGQWPLHARTLSDDSVMILGLIKGTSVFGAGEPDQTVLSELPGVDATGFVARFASDGAAMWAQAFGGTDALYLRGVAVDPVSDAFVVVGSPGGLGELTFGEGAGAQVLAPDDADGVNSGFVVRWAPDGAVSLAMLIGVAAAGVAVPDDGGPIVVGSFVGETTLGAGTPTETTLTSPSAQATIARFDAAGALVWAKQTESGPNEPGNFALSVAARGDGSSVVVGVLHGDIHLGVGEPTETSFQQTADHGDAFAAAYDPNGALLCATQIAGDTEQTADKVLLQADGSWLVSGYLFGGALFGPGTPEQTSLSSRGANDVYRARYWF